MPQPEPATPQEIDTPHQRRHQEDDHRDHPGRQIQPPFGAHDQEQDLEKEKAHGNALQHIGLEEHQPLLFGDTLQELAEVELGQMERIADKQDEEQSPELFEEGSAELEVGSQFPPRGHRIRHPRGKQE